MATQLAGRPPRSIQDSLIAFLLVPVHYVVLLLLGLLILRTPVGTLLPGFVLGVVFLVLVVTHGMWSLLFVLATAFGWAALFAGRKRPLRGPFIDALVAASVGLVLALMAFLAIVAVGMLLI